MRRTLILSVVALAAVANAAVSPELDKAEAAIAGRKYPEALRAVDAAAKAPNLDRASVLKLYELRGVALALNKQEAKSKLAFEALLWLAPDFQLGKGADSKVLKAFKQARDWARANPSLEFRAEPAATDDKGRVMQIAAFLKSDPLKLVKKVRFHLRADARGWGEVEEMVQSSYAATSTEADGVEWWAELLGERNGVLFTLGSEGQPVLEGKARAEKKPAVAKAEPPPKKEPVAQADAATEKKRPDDAPVSEPEKDEEEPRVRPSEDAVVTQTPARPFKVTAIRGLGFGLMGAGVVSGVVGVILGASSSGARATLEGATTDGSGLVTGLTQKQAYELEAQANGNATGANVLYVTAGVLAAAGVVMVIAGGGGDDEPQVSLAPAGAGVVLSGTLP